MSDEMHIVISIVSDQESMTAKYAVQPGAIRTLLGADICMLQVKLWPAVSMSGDISYQTHVSMIALVICRVIWKVNPCKTSHKRSTVVAESHHAHVHIQIIFLIAHRGFPRVG